MSTLGFVKTHASLVEELDDVMTGYEYMERLYKDEGLSHKGVQRAAMFYSLACSCRLNNVNFFEYISDVINRTALMQPNTDIREYRALLPDKWKNL